MNDNTLADQIADSLRRDILLGNLKPGALIKERDSSAELGVSRTPMREAIRILASEGLVILRPSRSPIVANPSLKEITDDLVVMNALEILAARLACMNATVDELEEIAALSEQMTAISDTADAVTYFELDMKFHRTITAASHNNALIDTHASYMARLWRPRFLAASLRRDRPRVLRQHHDIVLGLESRDVSVVSREIESHMRHLVLNITDIYESPASRKAYDESGPANPAGPTRADDTTATPRAAG
jgi:GntR family transcriptional regulator, rspAB operon transcriptional repressor